MNRLRHHTTDSVTITINRRGKGPTQTRSASLRPSKPQESPLEAGLGFLKAAIVLTIVAFWIVLRVAACGVLSVLLGGLIIRGFAPNHHKGF